MIYILYTAHRFSGCGGVGVPKKICSVYGGLSSRNIKKRSAVLIVSQDYQQIKLKST